MVLKREILLIVVLLLAIALLVRAMGFFKTNVEPADATKFVQEDLAVKYPNADVTILETKELYNSNGDKYYEVKAKVTEGLSSPCPKRVHIYYDYPVQNFVPQPSEVITKDCKVCTEGTCILNYPEEAIIASHTLPNTSEVSQFVSDYPTAYPVATDLGKTWLVQWDSIAASYHYDISMDKNGAVLKVNRIAKSS